MSEVAGSILRTDYARSGIEELRAQMARAMLQLLIGVALGVALLIAVAPRRWEPEPLPVLLGLLATAALGHALLRSGSAQAAIALVICSAVATIVGWLVMRPAQVALVWSLASYEREQRRRTQLNHGRCPLAWFRSLPAWGRARAGGWQAPQSTAPPEIRPQLGARRQTPPTRRPAGRPGAAADGAGARVGPEPWPSCLLLCPDLSSTC